jgi:hypothetical protein
VSQFGDLSIGDVPSDHIVTRNVTIWKLGRTVCVYSMVQRKEKRRKTRGIQEASAPVTGRCIRPVTSCTSVTRNVTLDARKTC